MRTGKSDMHRLTWSVLTMTILTVQAGHVASAYGQDAVPELSDVRQRYTDASKALSNNSLQFSTIAVDPQKPDTVITSCKTRVARKGKKAYSERFMDAPLSKEDSSISHTGMSYDSVDSYVLLFTGKGYIYPGFQSGKFRNQDDFLSLQGYPVAGYQIYAEPLKKFLSCDFAELDKTATVTLTGDDGYLVVTGSNQRLTLDRSKNLAIAKRELYDVDPDSPFKVYTFSEFFEMAPSTWVGRVINIENIENGVIKHRAVIQLKDKPSMDVSDDLFVFDFPPGTDVIDYRESMKSTDKYPDPKRPLVGYQIPTSPSDLERVIADAKQRTQTFQLHEEKGVSWRGWLLGVNMAILFLGIVVWGYFRWRS